MSARITRRGALTALAAATVVALAGCSSTGTAESAATTDGAAFPVTIEHALGSTTIEAQPQRIVTLGWNAQDILFKLGVTPVGMPDEDFGAGNSGVPPWEEPYYDPAKTQRFDGYNSPYETIATMRPDVILAPNSGVDKDAYAKLSAIAPTVANPGAPWLTSWQDQTRMIGRAVGKSAQADKEIDNVESLLRSTAAQHPEFAGKTVTVLAISGADSLGVYMPTDARTQLLRSLGFRDSAGVEQLARTTQKFFASLSPENLASVAADVTVIIDITGADPADSYVYRTLAAAHPNAVLPLSDRATVAAYSQASILTTPWALDRLVPLLSTIANR